MKKLALLFLLLVTPAYGQSVDLSLKGDGVRVVKVDKVIIVKEDATVVQSFPFTVNAATGAGLYFWSFPTTVQAADKGDSLEVLNAPKGPLTISVKSITADLDKDGKFKGFLTKFGSVSFTVGDVPVPPDPKPNPPKPDPTIPSPINLPGFAVMFIEEQMDRGKVTTGQYNAMFGKAMRDWINANALKEGTQPAFRFYDKDQAVSGDAKHWQDAFKRRPASFATPWIVVSNGVTGWEGPMPATEEETKALLSKYLPAKGAN